MAKEMRGGPGSARKMRPVEMNAPKTAAARAAERSRPAGSKSPAQMRRESFARPNVQKFLVSLSKEAQKAGAVGSDAYSKRLKDLSTAIQLAVRSKGGSLMPVSKSLQSQTRLIVPGKIEKTREAEKRKALRSIAARQEATKRLSEMEKARKSGK